MAPSRLKLTITVMSIGLAREAGGGFQQECSLANTSLMVSSLRRLGLRRRGRQRNSSSARQTRAAVCRARAIAAHLMSDATCTFTILSGSVTAPPREPGGAFFSLSTTSMPDTTSPITVYWPFRLGAVGEHDEELRIRGVDAVAAPRHADDAALERHVGKFRLQVRIFRTAGAVEILAVAGLRHEAVHHAVERHVVVVALARQLLDALGMLGREVGAQLDDDAALGGVDHDRIRLVEIGGQRLRDRGSRADQRGEKAKNSDHENSGSEESAAQLANLVLRLAATAGGTNAETSPPMAAIWRTSVAVIGRTATEAGTNTVCTSGAMVSFMPAICIS